MPACFRQALANIKQIDPIKARVAATLVKVVISDVGMSSD